MCLQNTKFQRAKHKGNEGEYLDLGEVEIHGGDLKI
jgi:hypothetical protein